ncbi:MAG: diheme cytochrome c [Azonexus sp.]|nr:diheme cytochrome c [Azonexus sp.]MDP3638328.1 diheme cytochrome c [Azonexus sp.]MDZ4315939.1 diheme cytochrome c [Azonexus sp.]
MKTPTRLLVISLLAIAFGTLVLSRAQARSSHYFRPVADPVVKEECGGCHLAFAPSMLPASSWQRMMGNLKNHFGDDASLDAPTATRVSDYLVANAADNAGQRYGDKLLRGVSAKNAPLRITELPKWIKEHRKVPDWEWKHKDVRTRANCTACHVDAETGYYDE